MKQLLGTRKICESRTEMKKTVLYIGGFQLPDKNAAALRVLGNAKILKELGYRVVFLNALVNSKTEDIRNVQYQGFECIEYRRESQIKYLLSSRRVIATLRKIEARILIAYNYPAVALEKIRSYCEKHHIKCYADATEWYVPKGNPIFCLIKSIDTELRMRIIHPKLDGVIVISRFLYQFYKNKVNTIQIPPLVDCSDDKWKDTIKKNSNGIKLVYAGTPSAQKERLDLIVKAVEHQERNNEISLDVIGITKEQFNSMYNCKYEGKRVVFHGRIENKDVIQMTKAANWAVILREKNKVVQAGFPTKVSEAISCKTPIIANRFSNIEDYLNFNNSILIDNISEIKRAIEKAVTYETAVDEKIFDYKNYINDLASFINDK